MQTGRFQSDMRSTTGYCTFIWGNLVTWRNKKQTVVSRSSAEAELRTLALGICEGLWLRRILEDLRISTNLPIKVYCDNLSAISMVENPTQHDKSKHVEIDRHFILEKIEDKTIYIEHISSNKQIADIFTKPVAVHTFLTLILEGGVEIHGNFLYVNICKL